MKLIWHIFLKDLRRYWLLYGVWVLCLVAKVGIQARVFSPDSADVSWFDGLQIAYGLIAVVESLLCFLLTAALVMADAPVGSTQAWPTRPIAGWRLLAAKLLGIVLGFFVVPVLVLLPWWLTCGYGWTELFEALTGLLILRAFCVVPAFILAALVDRGSTMLRVLGVMVVAFLGYATSQMWRHFTPSLPMADEALGAVRALGAALLVVLTLVAVVWLQFSRRQLWRSLSVLALGLGVAALFGNFWPWSLGGWWYHEKPELAAAAPLKLQVVNADYAPNSYSRLPADTAQIALTLESVDVPAELRIERGRADVLLRWRDGQEFRQTVYLTAERHPVFPRTQLNWPESNKVAAGEGLPAQVPGSRIRRTVLPANRLVAQLYLPRDLAGRCTVEKPLCTVSARLVLAQPVVILDVPLQTQSPQNGRGIRAQVVPFTKQPKLDINGDWKKQQVGIVTTYPEPNSQSQFFVVQRSTGFINPSTSGRMTEPFMSGRIAFNRHMMDLVNPATVYPADTTLGKAAREHPELSLIGVSYELAGQVRRTLGPAELPWQAHKRSH